MSKNNKIEPQQLYQRLLATGIGSIELSTLFQYDLCSYPLSLFDPKLLLRLADKADLQNGLIQKVTECVISDSPLGVVYVLNGGSMLQRLPCPKFNSFINLCRFYIQFIHGHFQNVLVVFVGYNSDPSTKDETNQRKDFTGSMILKKTFIGNPKNYWAQKLQNKVFISPC